MKPVMVAQLIPLEGARMNPAWRHFLLIGGVTVALALISVLVILALRRAPSRRRRHHHGPGILRNSEEYLRNRQDAVPEDKPPEEEREHSRQRRKKRRRDHRPRKPSLAEAGGLPPERESDVTPETGP